MGNKVKTAYERSRGNLLAAILFTVINIVLAFMESDTMFLFSATIPYYYSLVAFYWGYGEYFIISIIILLLLVACWFFSKKHVALLIVSLIYFVIDTIFMLWIYDFTFDGTVIIDIVFHVWVIFYLVSGILYGLKKKNKTELEVQVEEINTNDMEKVANKSPLRFADEDVKARIFLEEEILGRKVVYRRVKTVNELVINGKVYDEYDALMEMPHSLLANIDGHIYEAGCNSASQLYLALDGEIIKKKVRII